MKNGLAVEFESAFIDCTVAFEEVKTRLGVCHPATVIVFALGVQMSEILGLLVDAQEYTPQQVHDLFKLFERETLANRLSNMQP